MIGLYEIEVCLAKLQARRSTSRFPQYEPDAPTEPINPDGADAIAIIRQLQQQIRLTQQAMHGYKAIAELNALHSQSTTGANENG